MGYLKSYRVVKLHTYRDYTDEWQTDADITFKLRLPFVFEAFGQAHVIDRMLFQTSEWRDPILYMTTKGKVIDAPGTIPNRLVREMKAMLAKAERGTGKLKDYCFCDDFDGYLKVSKRGAA